MPSAVHGKQHNSEQEATAVEAPIFTKAVLGIALLEDVVCTECVRAGTQVVTELLISIFHFDSLLSCMYLMAVEMAVDCLSETALRVPREVIAHVSVSH